ncbi:hypothetical protein [Streptomyces sp. NPDC099088]|uniref:hypothetical protein n=1 Tax=Streptomyces sp. NPDC099088 TaxID=3366101 RepID=UPI00380CDBE1
MEPISVALLAALAGGAGGELGQQIWTGLATLVKRPFRRGQVESRQVPMLSSGEAELVELQQAPWDATRAQALTSALAVRASVDAEFSAGLQQWSEQANLVKTGDGDVHNTISGGSQHGPVLQGRDFSGLTFTTSPPPPASGDAAGPARD